MRKHVWLLVLTVLALLALIAFLPAAADQPASPGGQSSGPTTGSDAQGVKPDSSWADKAPLGHPAGPFQGLLPDTWITAAPLPAPARYRQASAADNAGRVFHFGGGTSTGAFLNEVQIYDVASNSWSTGAPMPNAGQNMMAVYNPITNKFYLPGGYNGAHNTWCQVYDPVANSWSTCAPLPAARSPMAAFFPLGAQGRIYIFGGNPGPTNEVRYLDVATNTWSAPQAPMPTARTYGSALTVGNYIYVIGGVVASPLNTCERYDPNTNTWATCPGMLTGRMNPHATWYNVGGVDYIYAFAGGGAGGDIWTAYNTVERYDVSAFPGGSWQNVADPVPDAPVAAGYACANDQVWLAGGTSGGSYFQTNRGYSEAGGSCGSLGPTPTPTPTPTGTWYTPTPTITPTPTNTPMGRCETIPPDPFGYQCEDWVTRTWITATQNTGLTQDDQVVPIPIGFTFSFYGQNFTTANVSSNGNLQFTTSSTAFSNVCPLPSGTLGLAILPFWDDLYLPAGGAVYYDTVGTAPNRIFVVEWRDVPHIGTSPSGGTFEVQIEESTGDIWLLYQDVDFGNPSWDNGASASVGIQNGPGGYALQYSCNQAVLAAGRVVHIFRPSGTVTPTPTPTNTPVGPTPTPTCPPAGNFQVLIVHADDPPPTTLQSQLLADPNVTAVDLFDAQTGTPSLAQLQQYDIVVVFSNYPFFDPITLGNNLADYQDGGGVVVANFGSFYGAGNYGIQGRWQTGGYSPYNYSTSVLFNAVTLGTYDPTHPLMQGVTTLNAIARIGVTLASGATQVAAYSDNSSAVAFKATGGRTAVGMPAYIGDGTNSGSGDYARVIVNAGLWLLGGVCPTATPTGVAPTATPTNTPVAGQWTPVAPVLTPVSRPAGAFANGKFYVISGEESTGQRPGTVQIFDPATGSWSLGPQAKPVGVSNVCAAAIGNLIYVPAGYNGSSGITNLDVLDTSTNTWSTVTTDPVPEPLFAHTCAATGGKLYVAGGSTSGVGGSQAYVYDPAAPAGSRWSAIAPLNVARAYPAGTAIAGKVYVAGGWGTGTADQKNTVEVYDPATNTWTVLSATMSQARGGPGAYNAGDLLVVCAGGWSQYYNSCEAYNVVTGGTWSAFPTMVTGRRTFAYAWGGGTLYAASGFAGSFLSQAEKFTGVTPPTSVELAEFGSQAAADRSLMWMIPLVALGLLLSWALLRHRRRLIT